MENDYHNPYDHRRGRANDDNHYDAPSCLVRNPSGSLFIPSSDPLGHTTLDSRLRYDAYSPHHQLTMTASGHHLRENQPQNGSPCRSPAGESFKHMDTHRSTLSSYATQGVGLTSGRLGKGGLGSGLVHSHMSAFSASTTSNPVTANLATLRRSSPNSASQWRIQKDINGRCSWKFVAIFFVLLSVILISALIYTTASNFLMTYDNAKTCAVIESATPTGNNNLLTSGDRHLDDYDQGDDIQESNPKLNSQNIQGEKGPEMPISALRHQSSIPPDGTTFGHLTLGELQKSTIPPYSYWNFQYHLRESSYIEMMFHLPRSTSLGLYGRKNALPTLTINDIRDVISGNIVNESQDQRSSRSLPSVARTTNYYLDAGHWFISIYNDNGESKEISVMAKMSSELTKNCPKGCSGKGQCVLGQCQCETGFDGADCSQSVCPVLCTGNGDYEDGQCRCYPGWKGLECQLKHDECEMADCNGHGKCVNGNCVCARGFTGPSCDQTDCSDPNCSGHGFCVEGVCVCRKGWRGQICDQLDHEARQCLPDCSGHGEFDLEAQKCVCKGQWTGRDCSKEKCNMDCGPHGSCESARCACEDGWLGDLCNIKTCDSRCTAHGMCSNGTCLCTNGWNGKHCTLEGCPNNCNGHGQCKSNHDLEWECWCESGWFGLGCDISLEQDCSDRKDNDEDGLTDCEDPECCESPVCQKSQLCHTVPQPIDILLRKQPPALTASFFERMKFIIEDKGLQSYVQRAGFNESRAAVVRGRVITGNGMGLIGVRVSTTLPNEGFTMTRDDGWFDLMVNGGGPVMLQFGRNPYPPLRLNLFVPWNEVVVLDPVRLTRTTETGLLIPDIMAPRKACKDHDFDYMKPLVLATWKHGFKGQIPERSAILVESQAVQESLSISDNIFLIYHSARTKGYLSTIQLQLTPDIIPVTLVKVHLKITIEGVVHEKVFEADPNIRYTYAWDRLNEYRQRVYGITTATVKVGYEYSGCDKNVWHIQTAKLSGHDMANTDIGGWNLHMQHKYNFHSGILQKGDGNTVYLKYKPQVVTTVVGNGDPRGVECTSSSCTNGPADKQKLLAPKALASAPDGALYIADYNLIRKLSPDMTIVTLLRLNSTRVSYRFHLAQCTYSNELEQKQTLYVSLPELHQVIRLKNVLDGPKHGEQVDINANWEPFIGQGDRCLPGDNDRCGDGGKASEARLAYPKGLAVGVDGKIFIADGTNIRQVDENGIISTVIGHQNHRTTWKPMPCEGALPVDEVQLNWPTEMAVSPLDGSLHFIDDNVVLKLTHDGRVKVVAGRPLHCPPKARQHQGNDLANGASLIDPQSISFAPNGDLYIAESDSQRINRIRRVTTDGKISTVAGKDSKCNCLDASCACFDDDQYLAANVKFSAISSISVTPDGVLYIADQGNYRLRAVSSSIPLEKSDGVFEVPDTESQEIYIFNKFGQHVLTKDIMTGNIIYKLAYTQATSSGKLMSVTDSHGKKLTVMRDFKGQVNALQTSDGLKYTLLISRVGDLETFDSPQKYTTSFKYHHTSGLLKSKFDNDNMAYIFEYDAYGRLVSAVLPSGELFGLRFNLTTKGASVDVTKDGLPCQVVLVQDSLVSVHHWTSKNDRTIRIGNDKTLMSEDETGTTVTVATIPHPVIAMMSDPVMADSFPMPGEQRTYLGNNLISELSWQYSVATNGHASGGKMMMGIRKTLRVNGENLLTVFYDKLQKREVFYVEKNAMKKELLEIRYDSESRPIIWNSRDDLFKPLEQAYDRFGHLKNLSRGNIFECYHYDDSGRLTEVSRGNVSQLKYVYRDAFEVRPSSVLTGSNSRFSLDYDEKTGGLKNIQTPRGHFHAFRRQPTIGGLRFQYQAPWIEEQGRWYELIYDCNGRILTKRMPSPGNEQVSYSYDNAGTRLRKMVVGETETEYNYEELTGLLESVMTKSGNHFDMRTRYKYHGGLMKEQKVRFSGASSPDFDNAVFRYQYDGNGRPSASIAAIGSSDAQETFNVQYNPSTGEVEILGHLRITRLSYNCTILRDTNDEGNFHKSIELDPNGRLSLITYGLRHKEMLNIKFAYDGLNRMNKRTTINHEGTQSEENYSYSPEGSLVKVRGPDSYGYSYDENGNLVTLESGSGGKISFQYDKGDRVEKIAPSGVTPSKVLYDNVIGCVRQIGKDDSTERDLQRFWHDARGKLKQLLSVKNEVTLRVTYHYDHLGRLIAWSETRSDGKTVDKKFRQYFYSDVRNDNRVTHVHNPKSGMTQRLLYDHQGHLTAIETPEQKLIVATDQMGTPILIFKSDGAVLKEMKYSPFGTKVFDSNKGLEIPIGYAGAIINDHAPTLHHLTNGRIFNAELSQWLCPDWESLQDDIEFPYQLFVYRFKNNNPIHEPFRLNDMADTNKWVSLFGYDLDKILDVGNPSTEINLGNDHIIRNKALLSSKVTLISALESTVHLAREALRQLNFIQGKDFSSRVILNSRISSLNSAFGDGFLLSVLKTDEVFVDRGLTTALFIEGIPGVIQNIFASILNGSLYLADISFQENADRSIYYFSKLQSGDSSGVSSALSTDMDTVNRLTGEYNVELKELSKGLKGKDLKISKDNLELHVLYADDLNVSKFQDAIHDGTANAAIVKSWTRERGLVLDGFTGYGDWTKSQKAELAAMRPGSSQPGVRGFEAVEIAARNRFPQLLKDVSNYGFISEIVQERRRKSRHGRSRKHS